MDAVATVASSRHVNGQGRRCTCDSIVAVVVEVQGAQRACALLLSMTEIHEPDLSPHGLEARRGGLQLFRVQDVQATRRTDGGMERRLQRKLVVALNNVMGRPVQDEMTAVADVADHG
tara:strand:- start:1018 stop:1371 length:354 start_codon:yes stop_codon:yes gene_type:complete